MNEGQAWNHLTLPSGLAIIIRHMRRKRNERLERTCDGRTSSAVNPTVLLTVLPIPLLLVAPFRL